ncbi:hypothetical protein HMI56_000206 [Coelomomyces lativittatus]|nr:hypothetical protein HMI56_000206 [Coelomomyces lativittatus]
MQASEDLSFFTDDFVSLENSNEDNGHHLSNTTNVIDDHWQDTTSIFHFMSTLSSSKSRKLNTSTSLEKNDLFLMLTSFLENPFSTLLQWLWTLLLLLLFHPWVYHLGHGLKLVGQVVLLISNVYTLPRTFCKCISFLHLYVRQQYPLEPGKY